MLAVLQGGLSGQAQTVGSRPSRDLVGAAASGRTPHAALVIVMSIALHYDLCI